MEEKITSAGRLLAETQALHDACLSMGNHPLHKILPAHFKMKGDQPWQIGVFKFEKLVERVRVDLDVLTPDRAEKYNQTLNQLRGPVHPANYSQMGSGYAPQVLTELVFERLENFHENLILSGRFFSVEQGRLDTVIEAINDLIADINSSEKTPIDEAVVDHLGRLLGALNRYNLFGPEGVEDYVSALVGSAYIKGFGEGFPLSPDIKDRIVKVLGVAKAVMDGFVYTATIGQSIEWSGQMTNLLPHG